MSEDVMVFPDTRGVLFDLIDGAPHLGEPVTAFYYLPADAFTAGPYPLALIYLTGGSEGFIDRVDRVVIEVYAPGERAVNTLESIRASIIGDNIETPTGFVDSIATVTVPVDVPFQSETLNKATASFDVTSRPVI